MKRLKVITMMMLVSASTSYANQSDIDKERVLLTQDLLSYCDKNMKTLNEDLFFEKFNKLKNSFNDDDASLRLYFKLNEMYCVQDIANNFMMPGIEGGIK